MEKIRILCTGDLHLGRTSSKCTHEEEDISAHSARKAWERIVDYAVDSGIDILLLSGDIADDKSNQYEAMGPFEAGINKLSNQGLHTYAVAGNHDAYVLPRIAAILPDTHFHLLGARGKWEQVDWYGEGSVPLVTLAGWSFPDTRAEELPLGAFMPQYGEAPLIAIAHCDYLGGGSDYAPVNINTIQAKPGVDMWLLGHIHIPAKVGDTPLVLNPGSPQALDPGEAGVHGPWVVEIEQGKIINVKQIPLSTVAYRSITIDVSSLNDDDELASLIVQRIEHADQERPASNVNLRLSCRVALSGRSGRLNALYTDIARIRSEQPLLSHDIFLDKIVVSELGPAYDLQQLRQRQDVIGSFADILCALEDGESEEKYSRLIRGAEGIIDRVSNSATYRDVEKESKVSPEEILKMECRRILDNLLRQEEERN